MIRLEVNIDKQNLSVYKQDFLLMQYPVSTAKNGPGEERHSGKTPRGLHIIRAKIGSNCPINTVFRGRRPTGEIYSPDLGHQYPERDWILTRIMWLSGLERDKNRLGNVDSMQRYIYIHGTPDENPLGVPASKGCIRMRNQDIVDLFEMTPLGAQILIT